MAESCHNVSLLISIKANEGGAVIFMITAILICRFKDVAKACSYRTVSSHQGTFTKSDGLYVCSCSQTCSIGTFSPDPQTDSRDSRKPASTPSTVELQVRTGRDSRKPASTPSRVSLTSRRRTIGFDPFVARMPFLCAESIDLYQSKITKSKKVRSY
jgi:hypothetical protein